MAGQLVIIQLRGHTSATSRLQSGRARPPSGLLCSAAEGFPVAARSTSLLLSSQSLTYPWAPFLLSVPRPGIVSLPLSLPHFHPAKRHPHARESYILPLSFTQHATRFPFLLSLTLSLPLSLFPFFSLLLFATSTPPDSHPYPREPEPRERRALIYRPHTLHWMERNMSAEKGNNH